MTCWIGVDVGGSRKGFHVAVLDDDDTVQVSAVRALEDAVSAICSASPAVVAVDSPMSTAASGASARACELELNRRICGIRWSVDMTGASR